ncbi:MAG TPA: hypothetical protein VK935_15390 [Actinomycetospora sp.]|nr:hypothetical protein [Actinomycetospora sp.]
MSGDRTLGLSWPVLIALAALAAVRIPLHDLGIVEEGTALAAVLVVVPPAWLFSDAAFAAGAPTLGGRLAGTDPATTEVVLRVAAAASSLVTGTVVGAAATLLRRVVPERASSPSADPR